MGCACSKQEKASPATENEIMKIKVETDNEKRMSWDRSSEASPNDDILPQKSSMKNKLLEKTSEGKVEDKYNIGKELGRGTFSIVNEGTNKSTGRKFALKFIRKKYVHDDDLDFLIREIDIMMSVNHPNVLSLEEVYETDSSLCLVMELVTGGELFYKIVDRGSYSEKDAADIVHQLVSGVKYLHSIGICHRDLKPENLLTDEEGKVIKIADFGLSKRFVRSKTGQQGKSWMESSVGTPEYAAPEVLEGSQYNKSIDMWSVGVITYVLLCGFPPFYGKEAELLERILKAKFAFPNPEWSGISENAKQFIKKLLVVEPKDRLTAEEALSHPFLTGAAGQQALNNMNSIREYADKRKKRDEPGWMVD